jgi:hypothetical protein
MYDSVEIIEIYPKILVYKNVYKDIQKNISTLKKSESNDPDRFFTNWEKWSIFGEYLNPVVGYKDPEEYKNPSTQNKKDQKELFEEVLSSFDFVTKDYCDKHNIGIFNELDTQVKTYDGSMVNKWKTCGPAICKYHISDDENSHGMRYHSDYQRERINSPGHQFAITVLGYFNDDYESGEIDFCIGKKLIKYKPVAGDIIVFPSGSPHLLTEDENVYLHGVMPAKGSHKYFSRMFWTLYQDPSPEWIENEMKFGKDTWLSMQAEIEKEYNQSNPQRHEIKDGIRIR